MTGTQSTFELIEAAPAELASQEQQSRETRYLFFAGDEPGLPLPGGMEVQSKCVPGRVLWRCAVTPVVSSPVKSRIVDIPDGRMLDGTDDGKGRASYLLAAGPEAETMLAEYGNADRAQWQRRWGLVELTAWRGKGVREVRDLNLTAFFFPEWPALPDSNAEVLAQLQVKRKELESFPQDKMREDMLTTCDEMISAVKMAQEYQSRTIQQGNIRITYPDSNDGHKPSFDSKDELFSVRSKTALAVNSLRGNQSDAMTAGLEQVLDKVLARVVPQQQSIDPQAIATIVAATMQSLQKPDDKGDGKPQPVKK